MAPKIRPNGRFCAKLGLDEAHVSQLLLETLGWLAKYRDHAEQPLRLPFASVPMTATPPPGPEPFRLDQADRQTPVLVTRLTATKTARLVQARGKRDAEFAKEMLDQAQSLLAPGQTVAVVVNRVASAREVFTRVQQVPGLDAILLTGRTRAFERDRLLAKETAPDPELNQHERRLKKELKDLRDAQKKALKPAVAELKAATRAARHEGKQRGR
jgi:hypothetical protein